jgi:hypothetical protein
MFMLHSQLTVKIVPIILQVQEMLMKTIKFRKVEIIVANNHNYICTCIGNMHIIWETEHNSLNQITKKNF